MSPTLSVLVIVLLLATNCVFVAAEIALIKVKRSHLENMFEQGSRAARLALRIQNNLDSYLAVCQLAKTMASLGLGWVGAFSVVQFVEPLFSHLGFTPFAVHSLAFLTGFLILCSLHSVVGLWIPKTLAICKPKSVLTWCAYPVHIAYLAIYPLSAFLTKTTSQLFSLFGVKSATHLDLFSGDEFKDLVASASEHGEIQQGQADMLNNLFEFDQVQVHQVMVPRNSVHCLDLSQSAEKNLKTIRETEHSRFPVVNDTREEKILGVVLVSDVYKAMLAGEDEPWRDLTRFCRAPMIVPESQRVTELFEQMRVKRVHIAMVVDEYGEFVGVVTLEDLLEEIVGEIQDETDNDESDKVIKVVDEHTWEADGMIALSEVERVVGLRAPPDISAHTISGLFMERLARMPEPADQIREGQFALRVESMVDRRVGKAVLMRVSDECIDMDEPYEYEQKRSMG